MATLRAATTNGTITLNPISGILTRPDTYQREGGEGAGWGLKIRHAKLPNPQVSNQANAIQTMGRAPTENTKVAPEP